MVSLQPQSHLPPNPAALSAGPPDLYSCDEPAIMGQFLPGYPPMQPAHAPGMQPPTSREEMVYPTSSAISRYANDEPVRAVTGLGIQNQIGPLTTSVGPSPMPAPYPGEGGSPAFCQYPGFAPLPANPYNTQDGYPIKVEPDALDTYGRPVSYELFQHQKTIPAKRGPFKDNEQRLATARTRKKGSCIRCRMQRIRVRGLCPQYPTVMHSIGYLESLLTTRHSVSKMKRMREVRAYHAGRSSPTAGYTV